MRSRKDFAGLVLWASSGLALAVAYQAISFVNGDVGSYVVDIMSYAGRAAANSIAEGLGAAPAESVDAPPGLALLHLGIGVWSWLLAAAMVCRAGWESGYLLELGWPAYRHAWAEQSANDSLRVRVLRARQERVQHRAAAKRTPSRGFSLLLIGLALGHTL